MLERYLSRLCLQISFRKRWQCCAKRSIAILTTPDLYERLAQFLDQNSLGAQQEQVYQRAIQKFPDRSWYHKLARFYLRQNRNADFARLSEQVIKISPARSWSTISPTSMLGPSTTYGLTNSRGSASPTT